MVEESSKAEPKLVPPPVHASRCSVSASAVEVVIAFGTTRALLDQKTGNPGSAAALEWFASIAMSPILADQTRQLLDYILKDYETKFGKIPQDPNFKIESPKS